MANTGIYWAIFIVVMLVMVGLGLLIILRPWDWEGMEDQEIQIPEGYDLTEDELHEQQQQGMQFKTPGDGFLYYRYPHQELVEHGYHQSCDGILAGSHTCLTRCQGKKKENCVSNHWLALSKKGQCPKDYQRFESPGSSLCYQGDRKITMSRIIFTPTEENSAPGEPKD